MLNTYIIPICDTQENECWIESYSAVDIKDAEEQLMRDVIDNRDYDVTVSDFSEFCDVMFNHYKISIGTMINKELF